MDRSLCILDIDETLITSFDMINVIERPNLKIFFDFIFAIFDDIAIWTSAYTKWYEIVEENVFKNYLKNRKFAFVWCSEKATMECTINVKNLESVWDTFEYYSKRNTIIIDNNDEVIKYNGINGINIQDFEGDEQDIVFAHDSPFYEIIKQKIKQIKSE